MTQSVWDGPFQATEFWAKTPSATPWFSAYKTRVKEEIVPLIANRSDVWLSVWNEPFMWDRSDGFTDGLWLSEMQGLVHLVRAAGATNILVIPAAEMGQDESVLLTTAQELLSTTDRQLVFDVHAYNKWLGDTEAAAAARIEALHTAGLAIVFGEVGPATPAGTMDAAPFLSAVASTGASVCGWLWGCGAPGGNYMLARPGCAERTAWGDQFVNFAADRADAPPLAPPRERRVFMHYLPWYSSATQYATQPSQGWCAIGGGGTECGGGGTRRQYTAPHPPLIGEYSQFDRRVLEYHLMLSHATGTDGFIVNINPSSTEQVEILSLLAEVVAEARAAWPWFTQQLVLSYDDAAATDLASATANFNLIQDTWLGNATVADVFFVDSVTGRSPLLMWSESAPTEHAQAAIDVFGPGSADHQLPPLQRAPGARGGVLLLARNAHGFEHSHGNFQWVSPPATGTDSNGNAHPAEDTIAKEAWGGNYYDDFEWIMARQADYGGASGPEATALAVGAVWPGFDDAAVPTSWNGGQARKIPRAFNSTAAAAAGVVRTLDLTIAAVLERVPASAGGTRLTPVDMPWVQVVTFNDWPEGTQLEPDAGPDPYQQLVAVRDFAARFTANSTSGSDSDGGKAASTNLFEAAASLYHARMDGGAGAERVRSALGCLATAHNGTRAEQSVACSCAPRCAAEVSWRGTRPLGDL